jgi:hypothetical protein
MSAGIIFYELRPINIDPCSITKEAYNAARRTWLCTGCASPKPGIGAIDVTLQAPPQVVPLNFVFGVSVGIIQRDFLARLGIDPGSERLALGKVFDRHQQVLDNFLTFHGAIRPIIRGDTRSRYRRCDVCGRRIYSPMGKQYLLGEKLLPGQIYESNLNDLIVRGELLDRIKHVKSLDLAVLELPIFDSPEDGKPIFYFDEESIEK